MQLSDSREYVVISIFGKYANYLVDCQSYMYTLYWIFLAYILVTKTCKVNHNFLQKSRPSIHVVALFGRWSCN